jgi:hypothetical protein
MPDVPTTGLTDQVIQGSTVHSNVAQEFIVTTRDKLELCLNRHKEKIAARQQWPVPFGIFVSVLLTLLTADFRQDRFGITGVVWQAIFIIVAVLSGVWLIYSLFTAAVSYVTSWWKGEGRSFDAVIKELTAPTDNPKHGNHEGQSPPATP